MPPKKNDSCKKYGLAITDYVLGEKMDITKEELIDHLRACAKCRSDLKNWQATYAVMRAKEYDSRPEVKARMESFIKELVNQPIPGEKPIDVKWELGSAAGKIYRVLEENGKVSIAVIKEKTGLKDYHLHQGIGWLAAQGKIQMSRDEHTAYVFLAESERPQAQI